MHSMIFGEQGRQEFAPLRVAGEVSDMYHIRPMSYPYAHEMACWSYPAEYAIYSFQKNDETVNELMNGEYYACVDMERRLAGYFCFGKSAQIPTMESDVYGTGMLDIGLGLKPELCGKGQGLAFMRSGMEYAIRNLGATDFRLTVACFNKRAINIYMKLGFKISDEVTHKKSHARFYLMICSLHCSNSAGQFSEREDFMADTSYVIKKLEGNFLKRNIGVLWFATFDDVKEYLLKVIPSDSTIGIGHSQTLQGIGITDALQNKGNIVYDKELGTTHEEVRLLKRSSLLADYYISSANAVSIDGRIVNIDHSGNRVAALAYGPDKVFIVIGKNKITGTYDEAMERARNIASPQNAKRAGYNPPCVSAGHCCDCLSSERVCNIISTIEGQNIKGRMTLLVVNEEAGY